MGIQVMPPGCHVRSHGHGRNDEIFFVYSGHGHCVIDGVTSAIGPGSTVVIGRFVEHSIHNDGADDLKFFWVFTPPGLELVIEHAGRPRIAGETAPDKIERPTDIDRILERAGYATPDEMRNAANSGTAISEDASSLFLRP